MKKSCASTPRINFRRSALAALPLLGLLLLPIGRPLRTQARFDPATVQPAPCSAGAYRCGYQPTSPDLRSSIPLAAADPASTSLPSRVDFSGDMPPVGHQGRQGSCVAWSTGYAVRSYQEENERGWGYDSPFGGGSGRHVFSPAYIYNQINGGRDNGSYIVDAARLLVGQGAAPWHTMPYDPDDYRSAPPASARNAAGGFRARTYNRLNPYDLNSIKAQLAAKNPVVVGMLISDAFYQLGSRTHDHDSGRNYGGHAVALVGYDDGRRSERGDRGAFLVFNSWGREWGRKGLGWVSYRHFQAITKEAMVIHDRRDSNPTPPPAPVAETLPPPAEVSASRGQFADRIRIGWSAVPGARAYRVHRAGPGSNDFAALAYAADTAYTDTRVQPDVAYRYKITAAADDRSSELDASPVAEGFAQANQQIGRPGEVSGFAGRADAKGRVRLSWNVAPGATAYDLIRWEAGARRWRLLRRVDGTVFLDGSPARGESNRYRVRGRGRGGAGPWSATIAVRIGGASTPPAVVTGLQASRGRFRDRIDIRWNAAVGARSYYLYRVDTRTFQSDDPLTLTATAYVDRSADARSGRPVGYVVVAANAAGHGDFSEPVLGFASPHMKRAGEILEPPANLAGRIKNGSLHLTWSPVQGAAEYYLFRKSDGESKFDFVRALPAGTTAAIAELPEQEDRLYWYTLRSKSALGGESGDGALVPVYVNAPREIVRERFLSGPGLDRFLGRWTALDWDGEGAPRRMELEVSSFGSRFEARLLQGGRKLGQFSGSYAAGSDLLETAGFKMQFQPETGAAVVEIPQTGGFGDGLRLAFLKEEK